VSSSSALSEVARPSRVSLGLPSSSRAFFHFLSSLSAVRACQSTRRASKSLYTPSQASPSPSQLSHSPPRPHLFPLLSPSSRLSESVQGAQSLSATLRITLQLTSSSSTASSSLCVPPHSPQHHVLVPRKASVRRLPCHLHSEMWSMSSSSLLWSGAPKAGALPPFSRLLSIIPFPSV
jgi:hypothetical protein